MTRDELQRLYPNASKSFLQLNADLGAVADTKRQQDQRSQSEDPELGRSKESLGYCVTIISLRRRLVDEHDNLRTGAKPLVDAITTSLGFTNDADKRLRFEFNQLQTSGEQGVIVKISVL